MTIDKKRLKILSKLGSTDMQELVAYLIEHTDLEHDIDQYREIDKQHLERIAELEAEQKAIAGSGWRSCIDHIIRPDSPCPVCRIAELEKKIEYLCLDQENYEPILVAENQRLKAKLDAVAKVRNKMDWIECQMDWANPESRNYWKSQLDKALEQK